MEELKKVEANEIVSVEILAAEINSIKEQTKKILLQSSIEIGKRLLMAKNQIDHGRWGEWVEENVNYSQRTASNLMKIFEEFNSDGDHAGELETKSQALADLSYTKAVALLGIPAEERDQFVEENDVESMSTRELIKSIEEERDKAILKQEALQTSIEDLNDEIKEEKKTLLNKIEVKENIINEFKKDIKKLEAAETIKKDNDTKIIKLKEKIKAIHEEKEDIEKRHKSLEAQMSTQKNVAAMKYKIYFEEVVSKFNELIGSLDEIKESDINEYEKFRNATLKLLDKLLTTI